MSTITNLLKSIGKNSDGFEDVEQFWTATDKLTFPLDARLKATVFKPSAVSPSPKKTALQKLDSDVEFDYDTSSTISDDEEDDDEEEEGGSSDDENGYHDEPSPGLSVKTGPSNRSSIESSVYSPLNASLGTIGLSPLGTTIDSVRQSLESGNETSDVSARDSILTTNTTANSTANTTTNTSTNTTPNVTAKSTPKTAPSSSRRSSAANSVAPTLPNESMFNVSTAGSINDSSYIADRSGDMDETGLMSESHGTRAPKNNRRSSTGQDSLATPGSILATPGSASKSKVTPVPTGGSLLSPADGAKDSVFRSGGDRSNRRVSFGVEGLSPIDGSVAGTGGSKRSLNNSASINISRASSSNTSFAESAERSRDQSREQSRDQSKDQSKDQSEDNSFGPDYDDYQEDEQGEPDEEAEESMERLHSQADTPTTNRSSRTDRSEVFSDLKTPSSRPTSSVRSSTGYRSGISTPGSREFPTGYHMEDPDATRLEESTDEENDLDTSGVSTASGDHKRKGRKSRAVTDEEEEFDEASTLDVSKSFVDPEYLHQIANSNEKYQHGVEEMKNRKHAKAAVAAKRSRLFRDEEDIRDTSEEDSGAEDGLPRRRSKRATKGQRFAYWKGERPIYEEGTMVGVITVEPTPQKRKRVVKVTEDGKARRSKKSRSEELSEEEFEEEAARRLPPVKLPKGTNYIKRDCESLDIWDEVSEDAATERIFCSAESLQPPSALPRTAKRPPGKDKVGFAAHSFNVPEIPGVMSGWISGFIDLPPNAIKDAEGVGKFTQMFFVSDCQDGALEVGLASPDQDEWVDRSAQRLLLNKGDCFYVPPGNIYRLENHSSAKSSMLNWVIIKPIEFPATESAEEENSMDVSPSSSGAVVNGKPVRHVPIDVVEYDAE